MNESIESMKEFIFNPIPIFVLTILGVLFVIIGFPLFKWFFSKISKPIIDWTDKRSEDLIPDKDYASKMKKNLLLKVIKTILSIGFTIGFALYVLQYELEKNDKDFVKTLEKFEEIGTSLKEVEMALTTKHIGIFPEYLKEINALLLESLEPNKEIQRFIILQDLLFYGAFYDRDGFKKMLKLLAELARKKPDTEIIIAYYDNSNNWYESLLFREVVQSSWIDTLYYGKMVKERFILADSLQNRKADNKNYHNYLKEADSIVSETFFRLSLNNPENQYLERIKTILATPFFDKKDHCVFKRIDEIAKKYIGKDINNITFNNIYKMYNDVTEELKKYFAENHIQTIPLNTQLTMYCWSNGKKVLFALPGRFSAEEIGFISHDKNIIDYVELTLKGIGNNKFEK